MSRKNIKKMSKNDKLVRNYTWLVCANWQFVENVHFDKKQGQKQKKTAKSPSGDFAISM